ncbi:flavodoxin family protein [Alkaliphilus crotonatoxidans]
MKILAIMGSPRRGKNNDTLLDHLLKGIQSIDNEAEITRLNAAALNINPCTACDACSHQLGCIQRDKMDELLPAFNEADLIIMTSPMYFNSISAQLKSIIDRNQVIWSSKYVHNQSLIEKEKLRLGYMVCTAGAPSHPFGLDGVIPILDLFFKSINTTYHGNFFVNNVDERPVYENELVRLEIYKAGQQLVEAYQKAAENKKNC